MKKSISSMAAVMCAVLICVLGCATPAPPDTSKDETAIRALLDRYGELLVAYDADGWMALWDKDGVQMPNDAPMLVGKEEVRKGNYDAIKDTSGVMAIKGTIKEILFFPAEGYAYVRGVYTWTWTPKDKSPAVSFDGKYATLFKKQPDGSWLFYRDIFNSNSPPAM